MRPEEYRAWATSWTRQEIEEYLTWAVESEPHIWTDFTGQTLGIDEEARAQRMIECCDRNEEN